MACFATTTRPVSTRTRTRVVFVATTRDGKYLGTYSSGLRPYVVHGPSIRVTVREMR